MNEYVDVEEWVGGWLEVWVDVCVSGWVNT